MNRKKIRIVYVISRLQKSLLFEWIAGSLHKDFNITFILLNRDVSSLEQFLVRSGIRVKRIRFSGKLDYPRALLILAAYFLRRRPHVVHAHLLDAQLIGLTAALLTGVKIRVYTRHTSNYHQMYFPKGVKYDRWSNFVATDIVSISQATDEVLMTSEKVRREKITKIHHGFHLSTFRETNDNNIQSLRSRWGIPDNRPCVGVIARHIEWKGVQFIIPAFRQLLKDFPSAILVLANAEGPYHRPLLAQLRELPAASVVLIPFEEDVASLYAVFDLYVHVPIDKTCEAFGQTFIEALAAGIPSVFTKAGVAAEFVEHKRNAWVVDFCNADQIYQGLLILLTDAGLRRSLQIEGRRSVEELFTFEKMMTALKKLYEQ
jgi:glycosyltransferase involved in cell wall biosynthesis